MIFVKFALFVTFEFSIISAIFGQTSELTSEQPQSEVTLTCPGGENDKQYDGWCFTKVDVQLPMEYAESYCQGFGGHLASFQSEDEYRLAKKLQSYMEDLWIGLKQNEYSIRDNLDDFTWTDGKKVNYENFQTGIPITGGGRKKCVVMDSWYWVSMDCVMKNSFLCKTAAQNGSHFSTAFPPTTPQLTVPCEDGSSNGDGWVANPTDDNQFCYLFQIMDWGNARNFRDAQKICVDKGGSLTSIHSPQENDFIFTNINTNDAWIGFNSMYTGHFVWADGSEDVSFENWNDGEPNDGDIQEDCVHMDGKTGGWNDRSCDATMKAVVCKKPKNGHLTTPKPTDSPTGNCPEGFYKLNGYCYKLFVEPELWKEALSKCKDIGFGFNLASVHSMKENALLASMLYREKGKLSSNVFIGGRAKQKTYSSFIWSDYSIFNFDLWAPGQPDNYNEDCIAMNRDEVGKDFGSWSDVDCLKASSYICKGPTSPSIEPSDVPKCKITSFESYIPYKEDCYMEFTSPKAWSDAEADCKRRGSNLVSINDWTQQAGLFSVIQGEHVWIGLKDIEQNLKAVYWSDGNPLLIHNWVAQVMPEEPSCVYMNSTDGKWYPHNCNSKLSYVCKVSNGSQAPVKGYCPGGFDDVLPDSDHCFSIGTAENDNENWESWDSAEMACQGKGAHLASIGSAEDSTAIIAMYSRSHTKKRIGKDAGLWIGLVAYRSGIDLGPIWRWSDKSDVSRYSFWKEGYPTGIFSTEAQCAFMALDGQWQNADCSGDWGTPVNHVCKVAKIGGQSNDDNGSNAGGDLSVGNGGRKVMVLCSLLSLVLKRLVH